VDKPIVLGHVRERRVVWLSQLCTEVSCHDATQARPSSHRRVDRVIGLRTWSIAGTSDINKRSIPATQVGDNGIPIVLGK
jgi:hypothetical protein